MKIVEIFSGISVQITNEESDILGRFGYDTTIPKKDLSERETQLANQLVNKDILNRKFQDGQIVYRKKSKKEV